MTPTPRLNVSQSIGGRWLTYAPPYAWLLPLWFSGSLLSTNNLNSWNEFLTVALINVFALGVVCVEFLVVRQTLWRKSLRREGTTHPALVVLGGVLFGITKAGLTVFLSERLLGIESNELLGKAIASTALAIIVVCIVPLALSQLELYQKQRTELIHRIVSRELTQETELTLATHQLLENFVTRSLSTLDRVKSDLSSLPQVLDELREKQVRPLSHEIWKREQQKIPQFTLVSLITVSFARLHFVLWPVVLGFVLLMGPSQIQQYGLLTGLTALAVQALVIFGGLALANTLRPATRATGILTFITTNVALTAVIAIGTTTLFGPIPHFQPLQAALAVFQVLATLTFFTSVYSLTRKTHRAVEQDLLSYSPQLAEEDLARAQRSRADRELAQLLHSQVQNVLLAKSLALKETLNAPGISASARDHIARQTMAEVEEYLSTLSPSSPALPAESPLERLVIVVERWSPVVEVTHNLDSVELSQSLLHHTELLESILNEALANAVRHGLARHIDIRVEARESHFNATVLDDGVGPRQGEPGLGTMLFLSIPGSQWSLTPQASGQGSQLRLTFPL